MNGTGTQADPYQVTTADEFIEAIAIADSYVKLMNDIDFNNSNYWNIKSIVTQYPYAFEFRCTYLDGQGFKITNVYMNDIGSLFSIYLPRVFTTDINNLVLEVIMINYNANSCAIFQTKSNYTINLLNCDFRIKYSNIKDCPGCLISAYPTYSTFNFINCIFNIDYYFYDNNNTTNLFYVGSNTPITTFKYCEFNINLKVNKSSFAGVSNYLFRSKNEFYYCPIFINIYNNLEVDMTTTASKLTTLVYTSTYDYTNFYNSYIVIQSKGEYPCRITLSNMKCKSTCFYDKELSGSLIANESSLSITNLHGLTTEQCKDASYLNSIGFFVAE